MPSHVGYTFPIQSYMSSADALQRTMLFEWRIFNGAEDESRQSEDLIQLALQRSPMSRDLEPMSDALKAMLSPTSQNSGRVGFQF
eukprot:6422186-Amphidinium_carterae.2